MSDSGAGIDRLTRRGFLAVAAAASVGAVTPFRVPANGEVSLPSSWKVVHDLLRSDQTRRISYVHLEYAPESPLSLWGMLSLLAEGQAWGDPIRSFSFQSPQSRGRSEATFVGTVELETARITVAAKPSPQDIRISTAAGDLIVTPVAVETIQGRRTETIAAPWRTDYVLTPEPRAAEWATRVCDALRESTHRGHAVTRDPSTGIYRRAALRV